MTPLSLKAQAVSDWIARLFNHACCPLFSHVQALMLISCFYICPLLSRLECQALLSCKSVLCSLVSTLCTLDQGSVEAS